MTTLNSPPEIAEAAEEIYRTCFKDEYERTHTGKFVVIDIVEKQAYVAEFAEIALQEAREKAPYGVFHLIRIGAPSAFKASYGSTHENAWDWTLRQTG